MASDEELVKQANKKRQEELAAAKAKAEAEADAALAGELRPFGEGALKLELDEDKPEPESSVYVRPDMLTDAGIYNSDWTLMVEDYNAKNPETPCTKDNRIMVFPTEKDAIGFLEEQAQKEPPRKFFVTWVDENKNPTGKISFSCGDGKVYTGQLNEIQEQLKAAQLEDPENANVKAGLELIGSKIAQKAQADNAAEKQKAFKGVMDEHRPQAADSPEANKSPLSTTPTPGG